MEQPGFVKELNEEMLQLYLSLTYVAGENTFFRGLKKLLPGRYLVWQNGKLTIERYWMPQFHPDNSRTLEQWADEIHTTIGEIMPEVKTKRRVCGVIFIRRRRFVLRFGNVGCRDDRFVRI